MKGNSDHFIEVRRGLSPGINSLQAGVRFVEGAIAALVVLLASLGTSPVRAQTPSPHPGIDAYLRGNYDLAIVYFTRAIAREPGNAIIYNDRAMAYRAKGDLDRALGDLNTALQLNPGYATAYSNRGLIYQARTEYDLAIADFNRAIELNPQDGGAYACLGRVYLAKGNNDQAIYDESEAIRILPGKPGPYKYRGDAYMAKGDREKAIADYDQASRLKAGATAPPVATAVAPPSGEPRENVPAPSMAGLSPPPAPFPPSAMAPPGVAIPIPSRKTGSGVFVTSDGIILTAAHVVAHARVIDVLADGKRWPAHLVKADPVNDVAILRCEGGGFTPLPIASSREIRLGQSVFTVGFPDVEIQGYDAKYTDGVISSLDGMRDDPTKCQISVPVQPGNSGGPLCDEDGNLVGIIVSTLNPLVVAQLTRNLPQNVNYAVKSDYILPLLQGVGPLPRVHADTAARRTEDVVEAVRASAVLITAY